MLTKAVIRSVAREVAQATDGVLADYQSNRIVDEPQITDRMLGAIGDRLRSKNIRGIVWNSKTLRPGHGAANEEQRHGADFMGVLDINLPDLSVKKGFLAQAKRTEPGQLLSKNEWSRLVSQCKTMLEITPDAFVAVYSVIRGVRFIPAIEVLGAKAQDLHSHYSRDIQPFFELFLECFIGDGKLHSAETEVLDVLRDYRVTRVLELSARSNL